MDNILTIANIILGILLAYTQFRYYKANGTQSWTWIKLLFGCMGCYWAGLYVVVFLAAHGIIEPLDPIQFGRIFVRPAITLSLALVAAGGLLRYREPH